MATKTYGERWQILGSLGEGGHNLVFRISDQTGALPGERAVFMESRTGRDAETPAPGGGPAS
jgi:hypothetical protein